MPAAVADVAGSEDAVLVFDCDLPAQVCEPIGRVEGATGDPLFLAVRSRQSHRRALADRLVVGMDMHQQRRNQPSSKQ